MQHAPRRSQAGLILAAVVIILAGFGIALVEMYRLPKLSIWGVVGGGRAARGRHPVGLDTRSR